MEKIGIEESLLEAIGFNDFYRLTWEYDFSSLSETNQKNIIDRMYENANDVVALVIMHNVIENSAVPSRQSLLPAIFEKITKTEVGLTDWKNALRCYLRQTNQNADLFRFLESKAPALVEKLRLLKG